MHPKRELSNCAKGKPYLFSRLHCASFLGIGEIAAELVEAEGCDINQRDSAGNTPLFWAAWNGHEGVVKILLGRNDVDPDKPDKTGRTPLSCAADSLLLLRVGTWEL